MQQIKHTAVIAAAVLAASCTMENYRDTSDRGDYITEITAHCADNGTRTVLAKDSCSVLWSPSDEINVFYGKTSAKFTSINTEPANVTIFSSEKQLLFGSNEGSDEYILAAYPYEGSSSDGKSITVTVKDEQSSVEGSFAPGMFPSVGRSRTTNVPFYNVCGGLCFSVTKPGVQYVVFSGNRDEVLSGQATVVFDSTGIPGVTGCRSGNGRVRLNAPSATGFEPGKLYYMSLLPTNLDSGFTIVLAREDSCAVLRSSSKVSVKRNVFARLERADEGLTYSQKLNRSAIQVEEVHIRYQGLEVLGSYAVKPDSTHLSCSYKDACFHTTVSVSYNLSAYFPNAYVGRQVIPYSYLQAGTLSFMLYADGKNSDVFCYEYETVSAKQLDDRLLYLEASIKDYMSSLASEMDNFESIQIRQAELIKYVSYLEMHGISADKLTPLSQRLNKLPIYDMSSELNDIKNEMESCYKQIQYFNIMLNGVTELPPSAYEEYIDIFNKIQSELDMIANRLCYMKDKLADVTSQMDSIAVELEKLSDTLKSAGASNESTTEEDWIK